MPVATLFLAAVVSASTHTQASPRPITIRDYRWLVAISSPFFSPDGRQIAFVKSMADYRTDKTRSALEVVDVATGTMRPLATLIGKIGAPHWAPTGDRVAYISSDRRGTDQVFVVALTAPATGAASANSVQLTHARDGVQQFSWSPRGERIAYVTPDHAAGNPEIDLFDFDDVGYLTSERPMPSHIWLIGAAGGQARRLTRGTWSVLETAAPFAGAPSDPSWSADGRTIVFARQANPFNSRSDLSTVAVADVATGAVHGLTGHTSYEYQPAFSSRSNVAAFLAPHGPTPLSVMDVFITGLSGAPYDLTNLLDRDITGFAWAGRDLIVEANAGVRKQLWRHRQTGEDVPLDLGVLTPTDFDAASSGAIAFVGSSPTQPSELYVVGPEGQRPVRLTHFNPTFARFQYGTVSELVWKTDPEGEESDGVLTLPLEYEQGRKLPLVVWVHGGPEDSARVQFNGFEGDLLRQTLAGEGYAFLQPNYRGSDNLGNHHEHAIYRDPGEGPARDVLAGIDKLIRDGIVDPNRITIAGHSYGGYMTTWLISHDHRWKCAIVADGAVDWRETYDLTSDGNLAWARDSLGGTPMDPQSAELYRTGSPITYADQITTPTFIITGTADETVPATESFELYHALKDRRVPVRFVGVPGAHHTPDSPNEYERFYSLMATWIRHWNPMKLSNPVNTVKSGNPGNPG